ncbi:hypothetical protein [Saccharothrix sp. HUAS TT1]|uniref:hypothetical protein n=1 Tax=unclassified Saccharothrix TaxID=2593673 RepID=UPI00345C0EA6
MSATADPLRPLTKVVRLLWSVTVVLTAGLTTVSAVMGAVQSLPVCFRTGRPPGGYVDGEALRTGASSSAEQFRICVEEPTGAERVLGFLNAGPSAFGYAIALLLLLLVLERASRDGVHTEATASGLRRLGWFVLIALPTATLVQALAADWLSRRVVDREHEAIRFLADWDVPWWAVVTGVGLLALGKIMRTSADMREDLEGTV